MWFSQQQHHNTVLKSVASLSPLTDAQSHAASLLPTGLEA